MACPFCKATQRETVGRINGKFIRFASSSIALPEGGIKLCRCYACGLIYKTPTVQFGNIIIAHEEVSSNYWSTEYDYDREVNQIEELFPGGRYDLLDVGAGHGRFLMTSKRNPGKRAAMDVVAFSGLSEVSVDKIFHNRIDDEALDIGGEQFDVVTFFDVFEHLYNPDIALRNLEKIIKPGGYLIVETGDPENLWVARNSLDYWCYIRYVEHVIFWSESAFREIESRYNFDLVYLEKGANMKYEYDQAKRLGLPARIIKKLFGVFPYAFIEPLRLLGYAATVPGVGNCTDHHRAIFRRGQ